MESIFCITQHSYLVGLLILYTEWNKGDLGVNLLSVNHIIY